MEDRDMRTVVVLGILVLSTVPAAGRRREPPPPPPRYGIEADLDVYPQDTPKTALASVLKAIDGRRYNYIAAQLTDPATVDKRVKDLGGRFESYLKLVTDRLTGDPEVVREMRRFLAEGTINVNGDAATVTLKDVKGRQVYLRKLGERWYFEDRQKPAK
jgi:hypothetical protein